MELQQLLSRLWRAGLLGVGACLALIPFVDRPDLPSGVALGWASGIAASRLLYMRLARMDDQDPDQAVRNIQFSSFARLSLSVLALLIAYKTPGVFDLMATGFGLLLTPAISLMFGMVEAQRSTSSWEKTK
ncbi:ATP synthase subunit I [Heliobacterium chlorum]|uniref:ATP synthase subunit I n=1 Tax=Heliobacterium chlorum TaxID=2698 RepID=A0ABR7T324_HELCL|nr:ATP synthase subunit I [Heliobacterium chlorum]MBC9784522.1 ATP synthase subunit I [Heliobacterium chlorum]